MKTLIWVVMNLFCVPFLVSCVSESAPKLTPQEESIIHLMLSQTSEVTIHRMRGATENTLFLHKDGHKEAVYDAKGQLVQDGINDGSYNYEHPVKNPFGHYIKDIEPWIKWGASPLDPTNVEERTYAYMGDLEGGIRKAREMWPQLSQKNYAENQHPTEFPKSWSKILKHSETRSLFGLVSGDLEYTDENVISTMKALNMAFDDVY